MSYSIASLRRTTIFRTFKFLSTGERLRLILSTIFRLILVLLDLIGVTLVGIAISIASGTTTSKTSFTGKVMGYITSFGFSHGYAVIALGAIVFFLFKAFLSIWLNHWMNRFTAQIERSKSIEVYQNMFLGSLDDLNAWTLEELNIGLLSSFQTAFGSTLSTVSAVIGELALIVVVGIFLAYSNFFAFVVLVAYFSILALAMHAILNKKSGQIGNLAMKNHLRASSNVFDGVRNFRQVASSGKAKFFVSSFTDARGQLAEANATQMTITMMPRYIMEVALMVGIGVLISQLSTRNILDLTPATVAVFVAGAFRIVGSLLPLQGYLALLKHSEANSKPAIELCEKYLLSNRQDPDEGPSQAKSSTPPEVTFEGVTYTYLNRARPANQEIKLKIHSGDFIAVKGRSGSGKSTFTDLLLGLREPANGKVLINGISAKRFVREHPGEIAYVSQSTPLLSGTLLENITLERETVEISTERLNRCIRDAHLSELVDELPEGLDTQLSASSSQLSGGQVQRVGLARALYVDSSLLILDEATSALDNETEAAIAENLARFKGEKTVVVVAHREATLKLANRIIEFSAGRAKENSPSPTN